MQNAPKLSQPQQVYDTEEKLFKQKKVGARTRAK